MNQETDQEMDVAKAGEPGESPFDYIIVGSGAGGGPLAARLALGGKQVLVLESGGDPHTASGSPIFPRSWPGEVHSVPGYHGAATEDPDMAWMFSVRHYEDDATQQKDHKYNKATDPNGKPGTPVPDRFLDPEEGRAREADPVKRGIFYPRSAGIGGCTGHHAMIMIAPNDRDWNAIADLTGDDSWRAGQMQGYFAKLEHCLYVSTYHKALRKLLGLIYVAWQKVAFVIDPRTALDEGGHGKSGWLPTSFIDPDLVEGIAKKDKEFFNILARTAISVLHGSNPLLMMLKKALFQARVIQYLDPNDRNTRRTKPEGVFLIPVGIAPPPEEAWPTSMGKGSPQRIGVREFLMRTQDELNRRAAQGEACGRLVIVPEVHVKRVIFDSSFAGGPPRAIGVEAVKGKYLYKASPLFSNPPAGSEVSYFTKAGGEVVLSGGAFNTPQLLMLSGVGCVEDLQKFGIEGPRDRDGKAVAEIVDLQGVGRNLQDRYEVSIVSEMARDFETLRTVSFCPGDDNDHAAKLWREGKGGLYGTNGGALAVMRRSSVLGEDQPEPDTFTFGAPAAFRGYYWNWSRELLRRDIGGSGDERKLWTWVILKAYTDNNGGTVRLCSNSSFDAPEICFHSFLEGPSEQGAMNDTKALVDTVRFFRQINARNPEQFINEIQPGSRIQDDSPEMDEWVRTQAWGHHACGTCRIGSDPWRRDTGALIDKGAVLDSKFRVHGVENLRVVDASVFPSIPGYFILAPLLMVSEKAADTLLRDDLETIYPQALREAEWKAIRKRRTKARAGDRAAAAKSGGAWEDRPKDIVGMALSGGGIRSATFSLGILQAMAKRDGLRHVDMISTVSGGGYVGGFIGRLFTRPMVTAAADPAGRVQDILKTPSGPMAWLRNHANYIAGSGMEDLKMNLGVYFRNVLTVHLVIGSLIFALFSVLRIVADELPFPTAGLSLAGLPVSGWWWLAAGILELAVLPLLLGYWLAPKSGASRPYPFFALLCWLTLLIGVVVVALLPGKLLAATHLAVILVLAWVWQEAVRREAGSDPCKQGVIVRNRLSRALGEALLMLVVVAGWVVVDTFARSAAGTQGIPGTLAIVSASLVPFLPVLRAVFSKVFKQLDGRNKKEGTGMLAFIGGFIGYPIAIGLLFIIDVACHWMFDHHYSWGLSVTAIAAVFSFLVGRAFDFLNLSTLQAPYAARLTRTFLGASNQKRVFGSENDGGGDVQLAHPGDDLPFHQYHPELQGGPLHLVNVCVNETVDAVSEREVRERQGISMCVGPHGVSTGRRFHSLWTKPGNISRWQKLRLRLEGLDGRGDDLTALKPVIPPENPNAFHVLGNRNGTVAPVESLTLGNWLGISGAAFSTGIGRGTRRGMSLLMGIVNARLGYWWDSGIGAGERPGRYPRSLWRRLKDLPGFLFRVQSLLLAEWQGIFGGPSKRLWQLSDGGHFDNTGLYELIRRRVPFMMFTDGACDPDYRHEDLARLARQARQDFNASIEWMEPGGTAGNRNWNDFFGTLPPPSLVERWADPARLGSLKEIGAAGACHGALARVTFGPDPSPYAHAHGNLEIPFDEEVRPGKEERYGEAECWILLLKSSLTGKESQDVTSYAAFHPAFPQDTTVDQFFDDEQWESYRALGESIGESLLR
ncbi:GMC family oxidoreductase N-terminal domain-containing protein [Luteolibacter ambystomatis]|uniref:GMC family oxidoreductase N-terminal domain-containing protein n=1 Tax=Luteolibacter ambystomatis TaxID=2824561 RepID=A0A975J1I6_9BACT|nr:GMC oxidoreductase [Luteolibacter ambystomatis]QUE52289.1 GMC family oxidoreductase N-terminal domain-containing protein [Luteolibacter ambystomatis]